MRLAYIANIRLPTEKAHGIQIMQMCSALAREGVEVELLIPGRPTGITTDPFTYYGVPRTFRITPLPIPDLIRWGKVGFYISARLFAWKSGRYARQIRYDVVYSRDKLVALHLSLTRGIRMIWEVHGRERTGHIRSIANRASLIIAISGGVQAMLREAGIPASKIVLAPDGVLYEAFALNIAKAEARRKLDFPEDGRIVLYAGHLYERKGVDTLARAAAQMQPGILVAFVGGTAKDIRVFARKFGSIHSVRVLGHRPPSDIPLYLQAADVLVIPNSARFEESSKFTSPMKLFEYMASGRPIVASDVPSVREALDETTAVFAEADNPASFAANIHKLLFDIEHSERIARAAQEKVQGYSWNARAKRLLEALKKVQ